MRIIPAAIIIAAFVLGLSVAIAYAEDPTPTPTATPVPQGSVRVCAETDTESRELFYVDASGEEVEDFYLRDGRCVDFESLVAGDYSFRVRNEDGYTLVDAECRPDDRHVDVDGRTIEIDVKDGKSYRCTYYFDAVTPTPTSTPEPVATPTPERIVVHVPVFSAPQIVVATATPEPVQIVAAVIRPPSTGNAGLIEEAFGHEAATAVCIANKESGLNALAVSPDGRYVGLFQIAVAVHGVTREAMLTPHLNVLKARELYDQRGWQPWLIASRMCGA